ncbi:MAG TPA: hypothetical protein VGG29_19965 [Caulobacteraceae bacterium]|jgi:heme/copper-type cytochrome/quinol oxidase subunit 1
MRSFRFRFGFAALWLLGAALVAGAQASEQLAALRPAFRGTYYVISHPQIAISFPAAFLVIAAVYWVLEAARLPMRRPLAWAHFAATALGVALLFAPRLLLSPLDEPRRGVDPMAAFELLSRVSMAGYALIFAGIALFILLLIDAGRRRIGPSHPAAVAP